MSRRQLVGYVTPLGDVYKGFSISGGELIGQVRSSGSVYRGGRFGDSSLNEQLARWRGFDRMLPGSPVTESSLVFPDYFLLYGHLVGEVTTSGNVYQRQSESQRRQLIGEVVGSRSIFHIGAAALLILLD